MSEEYFPKGTEKFQSRDIGTDVIESRWLYVCSPLTLISLWGVWMFTVKEKFDELIFVFD